MKVIEEIKIVIPNELKENQKILTVINQFKDGVAVLVTGENMNDYNVDHPIVRLFLMQLEGSEYKVISELEAFSFQSIDIAMEFIEHLPKMTALDILLIMSDARNATFLQ